MWIWFTSVLLEWFGLKIENKIDLDSIKIMMSEKEIIILCENLEDAKNYINFYATILFFYKKSIKIKNVFGLFTNFGFDLIRKKAREEFLKNLNHKNIIFLLEGENLEAYYNNSKNTEKLLGIEIRTEGRTSEIGKKEEILIDLAREIGRQKKIIFDENI